MLHKKTFLFILLLLLISIIPLTLTQVRTKQVIRQHAAVSTTITGLHVAGNKLLNGSGQPLVLRGVNYPGGEYKCLSGGSMVFDNPATDTAIAAIASWNVNAVRISLNEDCWLGINGVPKGYAASFYQSEVKRVVGLFNQHGIVPIVEMQWYGPGSTAPHGFVSMPDQDHAPAFWQSVATAFKDNSSVIFDLANEPHPQGNVNTQNAYNCLLNGCTENSGGTTYQAVGFQSLVTTIRTTGATNPIMLETPNYAFCLTYLLQYLPNDPLHNLIASPHRYSSGDCVSATSWDSSYAAYDTVANQMPIVAGEMGEFDCNHTYIDQFMKWADTKGIGYLAWTWGPFNCAGDPALVTDYNGTPSNYGVGLKNHLAGTLTTLPPTQPPISQNPSSTITPTQSTSSGPTPTTIPGSTPFSVTICPHGLGNCGDNVNPNSGGNTTPLHQSRTVTLTILDSSGQSAGSGQGSVTYTPSASNFQGTVSVPNLPSGQYIVSEKMDGFLGKQVSGIVSVTKGQTTNLSIVSLTTGDVNNDNQLDLLDYNIIIGCFGSKQATSSCPISPNTTVSGADINDDGKVDGTDYNLFIRELSVQKGR